jgi:cyanophycinase-like exopeptidase
MDENAKSLPGMVVLFGSGETTPSGRKIFEEVFRRLPPQSQVAILETPAGFELNSSQVAGRVAAFLKQHLKNYQPRIKIVAARKRDTEHSPNNPNVIAPLWDADVVFMGPGSPSYTTRQLRDSLAWEIIEARHRLGMSITLASAATIAIGLYSIPVYEIYKVGEDIHWKEGLNLLGPYGLSVVFVPHWNNTDGGEELDTSRCYMGKARFDPLLDMLPDDVVIVGIDEKTGLILDLLDGVCKVVGSDGITLINKGCDHRYMTGETFAMTALGDYHLPEPSKGLPPEVWEKAVSAKEVREEPQAAPDRILSLVEKRELARQQKNWQMADDLREQILKLGWQILDTQDGPELEKIKGKTKN